MIIKKALRQGEEVQVPSALFNFLFVVNNSSYTFELQIQHNDLGNPVVIIKDASVESEEDKAINEKLKKYKGMEI